MQTLSAQTLDHRTAKIEVEPFTCECCGDKGVIVTVDGQEVINYGTVRNMPHLTAFFLSNGDSEIIHIREDAMRRASGILTPEEFMQGM